MAEDKKWWDNTLTYIKSIVSSASLRKFQRDLFTFGVILILLFLTSVFAPIIIIDMPVAQKEIYSQGAWVLGIILIGISILFAFVRFINIEIRSKAEEKEEQVRERVSEIDIRLSRLNYSSNYEMSPEQEQEIEAEFKLLTKERDSLVKRESHRLEGIIFTNWGRILIESLTRLLKEEKRLEARNVANLRYGVWAAGLGMFILVVITILHFIMNYYEIFAFNSIPVYYFSTVPIAIISELVAIFFLRLFAQTEKSIERNKNEMTNIELRLTASFLLCDEENANKFDSLADDLAKEERNFVLGKNETSATAGIDKVDIDRAVEVAIKAMEERNVVLKKNETSAIADIDRADIDKAVEIAITAIKAMKAGGV